MFTCPEKDIHSIYLDGELPEKFAKDYESHIASCEKCRKELEKFRVLHRVFADDAESINLDKKFLNKSYERLQSKMRFSYVVKMSEPSKYKVSLKKTFIPMAAAAAAVFAIMLPMRTNSSQSVPQMDIMPMISNASITPVEVLESPVYDVAFNTEAKVEEKKIEKPLEIKAFSFEKIQTEKNEDQEEGLKIRLTDLTNMNSLSAENVSFGKNYSLDFIK